MPWVRLDDHFDEHPKIAQLDDHAFALWVCGLAYCNRNLTDGFIPSMVGLGQLRWCEGNTVPSINVLERAGLWEKVDGGWQVHDYADYQFTKAQVLAERAKKQASGQAGGQASAKARAQAGAQASAKARAQAGAQAKSKPVPVPVPVPVPSPDTRTQNPNLEREETAVASQTAPTLTPPEQEEDKSLWPEWYSLLWGLPMMKATYATASAWKEANGIPDELALTVVYALRDWWPRQPAARQRGDAYATWQNWCRRDKAKNGAANGTTRLPDGRTEGAPGKVSPFAKYG